MCDKQGDMSEEGRDRIKTLFHGVDMGLTFEGWKAKWGLPIHQSMRGCVVRLPTNERFDLEKYVEKMSERSIPLAQSRPRLLEFVKKQVEINQ